MDNIIKFGAKTEEEQEKRIPEFQFEIRYIQAEGQHYKEDFVEGFLTVMGGYYFIGSGVSGEVNWLWSAPTENVHSIKSLGPVKDTKNLN